VYDVEMRKITLKLEGHTDDINAVCFADPLSTNILYSGSDDSVVKVWDRRSMGSGREAGCLPGHMEGVTFVATKGDGRYLISNGKDQTLKLWDIRKMMEPGEFDALARKDYCSGFDYRWMVLTHWEAAYVRTTLDLCLRNIRMIVVWPHILVIVS